MKIYVAMHKKVELILPELYLPILVGSYNKSETSLLRDDSGENISKKNENYCELTGLYWIWKNSKEDVVGLCHYRRFLSKSMLSINKKHFLTEQDIMNNFKKGYNMILPKPKLYYKSIGKSFNFAPNPDDMKTVKMVLDELYPDYTEAYNKYVSNHQSYLCNVMVCSKDILNDYCEWLFNMLFEIEKKMDKSTYINDPYRKRMFGFLSERLLNVWIIKNADRLKIKEYNMINTEEKLKQRIIELSKQIAKKVIHK